MHMNRYRLGAALFVASLGWLPAGCSGRLDVGNPGGTSPLDGAAGDAIAIEPDGAEAGEPTPDDGSAREAAPGSPGTEKTAIQVDLLFDIDNSASMGDKQALLELAIPDLVKRLVNPNCLDANGNSAGSSVDGACPAGQSLEFKRVQDMHLGIVSSSLGSRGGDVCYPTQMTNNGQPFLDGSLSVSSHTDDQGHLLGRSSLSPLAGGTFPTNAESTTQSAVVGAATGAGPQNFIDWFPAGSTTDPTATLGPQALSPATVLTDSTTVETDFANLIAGVQAYGCGIESQLESWYRFLIQPDPYASIAPSFTASGQPVTKPPPGSWVGYDQTIIQQRHDFLRPNSLVAIVVLSDENDSEIDTRSFGGQSYNFMLSGSTAVSADGTTLVNAWDPPKATSACATNPASPQCTSCASSTARAGDPNCTSGNSTYTSPVDWGNDVNLRHVHMKQKYGITPQYPVQRYYLGLTSPNVPDRTMEYPPGAASYQGGTAQQNGTGDYVPGDPSQLNCTNPLFAPPNADGSTSLPDGSDMSPPTLCNAAHPSGPTSRGPGLVFFAHIGGVPHQLLQAQPGAADPLTGAVTCAAGTSAADCPQKDTLSASDWVSILGHGDSIATPTSGPSYDYSGIDPHMVESFAPRLAAIVPTGTSALTASGAVATGGGPDPISGREWVTNSSTTVSIGGETQILPTHVDAPVDLEYACIFPLVDPTTGNPTPRDCSTTNLSAAGPSGIPAVCGQCPGTGAAPYNCSKGGTDYNLQYFAKAYPTIREIELVHLMGSQGVLSSLCPIHPSYANGDTTDPVFGYRPAITSLINRLKPGLL